MRPDWAIFKVMGDFFVTKVAQMHCNFWPILNNIPFKVKTDLSIFWSTFGEKIGLLFISASGHTAHDSLYRQILVIHKGISPTSA